MVQEGSIKTLKQETNTNRGSTSSYQHGHFINNVQRTMQSRYKQYMEILGSHDSSDFKMMVARAQRAHQNVAVFGQSFKINMKNVSKGNKDIKIKHALAKRETRSPGTAMMNQYEASNPSRAHAVVVGDQRSPEDNFKADYRRQSTEQSAIVIQPEQNQLTLKYGHPVVAAAKRSRKIVSKPKVPEPSALTGPPRTLSFPQQKNIKNTKVLDKPCRVLLPTQYLPQVDVMLNQNELLISKRAQQLN